MSRAYRPSSLINMKDIMSRNYSCLVYAMFLGAAVLLSTSSRAECLSIRYRGKSSEKRGYPTLQRTVVRLKHSQYQIKSLCVRVNRMPVTFQISASQPELLFLNTEAQPGSEILAQYCTDQPSCGAPCLRADDGFFKALGADPRLNPKTTLSAVMGPDVGREILKNDEWTETSVAHSCDDGAQAPHS